MSDDEDETRDPIQEFTNEVQRKVDRANEMHNDLDQYITWSKEQAASVRARADMLHRLGEIDDEDRANYYQAARQIRTVSQRLEFERDDG